MYCSKSDILKQVSEQHLIELTDDEDVDENRRSGSIVNFQVDMADTSGHFEDGSGTAVSLGPGNTADRVIVGVQFRIAGVWYTITVITGDGTGDNAVSFSGGSIATGTYTVEMLASANVDTRVDRAIENADAVIDAYLGSRYTIPITTVPDMIRAISVDLALWNLYSRRSQTFPKEVEDIRRVRYEKAIEALKDIATGKISVGLEPAPSGNDRNDATVKSFDEYYDPDTTAAGYTNRTFSRGKLYGF